MSRISRLVNERDREIEKQSWTLCRENIHSCLWNRTISLTIFSSILYKMIGFQGSIGSWEELLWKVAELQEGWDALLEPTYNFTHQGRRWQSHRIHGVMYLTLMDHRVVECSIGLCCLYKEGHEDMM
ncbi:uncharacterized protein [Arachis hypogaea]|uniref:uncharacterized protein isoform X2 n=1 Tax=Arachis hypogaea TaxID=3818 RepID=UPI003B213E83